METSLCSMGMFTRRPPLPFRILWKLPFVLWVCSPHCRELIGRSLVETSLCSMGMFTPPPNRVRFSVVETSLCSMGMFTLLTKMLQCQWVWKLPFVLWVCSPKSSFNSRRTISWKLPFVLWVCSPCPVSFPLPESWKLPFFSLGKINLRINLYNR